MVSQMSDEPFIVPPCEREIEILHQDVDLMLIHKPHLLLSVPGRDPRNHDSVITRIQKDYPDANVCHRLDLDTSGIMIIPLRKSSLSHFGRQFQQRAVQKLYTAVVYGIVEQDSGTIDLPIRCDWENRPLQMVDHEQGKHSLTHFEVAERDEENNCTRMLLKPVTGRSHQLRIHMRELGHPILGCDLYAHPEAFKASERMLLHATTISFIHPTTLKKFEGHCPPEF